MEKKELQNIKLIIFVMGMAVLFVYFFGYYYGYSESNKAWQPQISQCQIGWRNTLGNYAELAVDYQTMTRKAMDRITYFCETDRNACRNYLLKEIDVYS